MAPVRLLFTIRSVRRTGRQCNCKSFATKHASCERSSLHRIPNYRIIRGMNETLPIRPDYEGELRKAGVRITRPRKVILSILAEAGDHPDALEIFKRAVAIDSGISLSTVYRTMKLLEGVGAIHRHAFEGGPSRFEPAGVEHHDHLIDLDTGDVIEFHSERIEELQQEIARELGYDIVHHRLELYGRKRRAKKVSRSG